MIPGYADVDDANRICSANGAVAGVQYVQGTDYIKSSFRYDPANKWRNVGIVIGFIMYVYFLPTLDSVITDKIQLLPRSIHDVHRVRYGQEIQGRSPRFPSRPETSAVQNEEG